MIVDICPNCFSPAQNGVCSSCGHDQTQAKQYEDVLNPLTILNARYLVGRVLGKGGFGVTYIAKDLANESLVAIKECMPEYYSYRDLQRLYIYEKENNTEAFNHCKRNFQDEISALAQLRNNKFVVNVYDQFSENNTEYFVMEYIDGVSLKVLTNSQGGKSTPATAASAMFTVGSALMDVHKNNILHRDISPENIMIDRNGEISLIDFGASKTIYEDDVYRNESIFLKPGFAPPEQYSNEEDNYGYTTSDEEYYKYQPQGPWTDIYALAATYYTVVSGQPLIESTARIAEDTLKTLEELDCGVSPQISAVISKAMSLDIHDRYSNVSDFLMSMMEVMDSSQTVDTGTLDVIANEREYEDSYGYTEGLSANIKIPYLEILNGNSAGKKVRIPDYGFLSIGRGNAKDKIVLDDFPRISRDHCYVGYDRVNSRFIVIDRSSNGTYFWNGHRMLRDVESFVFPDGEFVICENGIRIKLYLTQVG